MLLWCPQDGQSGRSSLLLHPQTFCTSLQTGLPDGQRVPVAAV